MRHGTGGPVFRSGLVAAAGQRRVLRTEPGRDATLAVGDDERVAAPCDDSLISTRNSTSLFACRRSHSGNRFEAIDPVAAAHDDSERGRGVNDSYISRASQTWARAMPPKRSHS